MHACMHAYVQTYIRTYILICSVVGICIRTSQTREKLGRRISTTAPGLDFRSVGFRGLRSGATNEAAVISVISFPEFPEGRSHLTLLSASGVFFSVSGRPWPGSMSFEAEFNVDHESGVTNMCVARDRQMRDTVPAVASMPASDARFAANMFLVLGAPPNFNTQEKTHP